MRSGRRAPVLHGVPTRTTDFRFSDPAAGPTPWADAEAALARAESYWLTTVRL